jgi:UDP-N-acetylglucosamine--dolichyl-phosphate N-acetylglucosaminephosphotransferase
LTIKLWAVSVFGFLSLLPYLYFLSVLDLDAGVRRAILINSAMGFAGLLATVLLIPVASKYVLRRGMFGYDINKRGSPAGLIQV